MIPNDFIQTLLSRVDIVEVIDRHVPLKKAGANTSACCPFHSEKTPSFSVSPTKQFYHCFGCGAHGTALGFLMEHAGKSFPDAVEDARARRGPRGAARRARRRRASAREEARDLYRAPARRGASSTARGSKDAPRAIDYLKARGLTGEVAARFGIGYAPDGWQTAAAAFPNYDDAGARGGGPRHRRATAASATTAFATASCSRSTIPAAGSSASAAACWAAGEPKYLNSPETAALLQGPRALRAVPRAKRDSRCRARWSSSRATWTSWRSPSTASTTRSPRSAPRPRPTHAQKLFRLTDTVVFCFDGDNAGRKAAWRALENTLPDAARRQERPVPVPARRRGSRTITFAGAARRPSSRRSRRP